MNCANAAALTESVCVTGPVEVVAPLNVSPKSAPANASLLILQSIAASARSATVCKYNAMPIGAAASISEVVFALPSVEVALPLAVEVFAPLPEAFAFASLPLPLAITFPLSLELPAAPGVLPPSNELV